MSDSDFDAATYYRLSLAPEDRERLPRYAALVDALGDSRVACELLGEVRAEQRNPMLVLAALHYHALLGDDVLAPLYANVSKREPEDFAREVVRALEARPELVRDQLHRSTQTNEPGRSAVLASVLRALHQRGVNDIHLIDVGTSMGLNLYPDMYRVNEEGGDGINLAMHDVNENVPRDDLPRIHQRIGIDLNPLDPRNPDDVLWLRACLWPEQPERNARFERVLDELNSWPRAIRLQGSALERIDEALSMCSLDATPVVFHSWAVAYFSDVDQRRWREIMLAHVAARAIWVYFEHPWSVKALDPPTYAATSPHAGGTQVVVCEQGGVPAHWGWAHPHGRWLAMSLPANDPH